MNRTVLIADGDTEFCELFRWYLSRRGFDVETASDALDCLQKLRQGNPSVLVLDRDLRWGGGDGLLAWLRENSPGSGIPVILTAAQDSPSDFTDSADPPVVDFLPKPFAQTALLRSVKSALAEKIASGASTEIDQSVTGTVTV